MDDEPLDFSQGRPPRSHGTGEFRPEDFARLGRGVVFERGVLVFHPERIEIGDDVYVGHYAILKGYHERRMAIGAGTWIGQGAFLHSAGGLTIGRAVGIGPGVQILTSEHRADEPRRPVLHTPLDFAPVVVEDGCDLGAGAILLPGVRVGRGAIVGAGAVVTGDVEPFTVVAGVPARLLRRR
jgi:acetyltransferase-like isoleucine patch superfamily enzyme